MIKGGSTVLIVDDNPAGREVLADALETEGYSLAFAADGHEALSAAEKVKPDLILLDVMMPVMDGFEMCRRLRGDAGLAEIPVVMVTALDNRSARLEGIQAGADDFISKPFNRLELRARVRTITRLNRYRKLQDEHRRLERAIAELRRTHDATLIGWVKALDLRDKETEGHSERVVRLSVHLGEAVGIAGEDLVHLRRGALLHDVGKLGVPDAVLLKAEKLTEEEWQIMRQHPVYAREWLQRIPYLRRSIDIPYCHHERWDGTGYPQGLAGEQIPWAARMFALVDMWDTIRSDRPYRKGLSMEGAIGQIRAGSGEHFDPQLAGLFLDLLEKDRAFFI